MRRALLLLGSVNIVSAKVYFSETFNDGWENRWTLSKWKDSEKEKMGKWVTATGKWFGDEKEDRGLQTSEIMKFYSIAAPFEKFSNEGKELIVQYQAKYEKDLGCGGGYLKVGPKQEDLTTFGEPTPYNIMFGPDQCNTDKRTHLIFSHKGKNFLKTSELPYKQEGEGTSHLYRLVLKPDGTVHVDVDQEEIYNGSLKSDWGMLPTKTIEDPDDKMPEGWATEEDMADPDDKQPKDWVTEKKFVDANAKKPEEWDEDEDGVYEAPEVDNPDYKGEWLGKRIPNPEFKGAWKAKQIANPDFEDDPALGKYTDFGFVGFDVYQVKGGTIFDNIIITDTVAEADEFAKKWKSLSEAEKVKKNETDTVADSAFEKFRAARAIRNKVIDDAKKAEDAIKGITPEDDKEPKQDDEMPGMGRMADMPDMPDMPEMPEPKKKAKKAKKAEKAKGEEL